MSGREAPDIWAEGGDVVAGDPNAPFADSLSVEEREAAAVLVACLRRAWILAGPSPGIANWTVWVPQAGDHRGAQPFGARTPLEAFFRALEAEGGAV